MATSGCVERFLRIDTDPAGAKVTVNGQRVEPSAARESGEPGVLEWRFTYYGTVRIDAWIGERPGVTQYVELVPPWYELFPFDLVSELLDPFTHVDRQQVTIALPASTTTATRDEVLLRAEPLRTETR